MSQQTQESTDRRTELKAMKFGSLYGFAPNGDDVITAIMTYYDDGDVSIYHLAGADISRLPMPDDRYLGGGGFKVNVVPDTIISLRSFIIEAEGVYRIDDRRSDRRHGYIIWDGSGLTDDTPYRITPKQVYHFAENFDEDKSKPLRDFHDVKKLITSLRDALHRGKPVSGHDNRVSAAPETRILKPDTPIIWHLSEFTR